MDVDAGLAAVAAAVGEPARARMLLSLLDGRARTSTELAVIAGVGPPTATVHLQRLERQRLVAVAAQGKHRYYRLATAQVAAALEALSVLAGQPRAGFRPSTPAGLRAARTCYDHIAGALGVGLHDRLQALGWLERGRGTGIELTPVGARGCAALGVDVAAWRRRRRRFAYACLDWSERRPHLGGALGAALLVVAEKRRWVERELDSRALILTRRGRRELEARFGLISGPVT